MKREYVYWIVQSRNCYHPLNLPGLEHGAHYEYEPAFVHMNLEGRKLLRNKKRVQVTFTTVGESTVGEEFSLEW